MLKRDRAAGAGAIGDFSDPALISTLAGWLEAAGASELEITTGDGRSLKIVLDAGLRPAAPVAEPAVVAATPAAGRAVKAPIAGRFRDRHPGATDAAPLAEEGRTLEAGALAGFIEVGPILLPVRAVETAVIAEIHALAGDLVGYGDAIATTEAV